MTSFSVYHKRLSFEKCHYKRDPSANNEDIISVLKLTSDSLN